MNGNKVLVTGGFGNLGSYIVKNLIDLNYEVTILTRREKYKFENLKYKVVECDTTNLEELKSKLNYDFDFCVHCASFNEFFLDNYPKKALEINTLGTRNLLEVLAKKGLKHFLYFSTFHVYGASGGIVDENSPINPKNDYASTHLFAEYYIKQFFFTHKINYTIIRLTNSYGVPLYKGTDKWYLVINDLSKVAFETKKIIIKSNGEAKRDFIHMQDVAVVVDKLLQKTPTNDIYNLSSTKTYKIINLASIVKDVYEKRYNQTIDISINKGDKNIYEDIFVDNKKLKNIIDFDTEEKIEESVNKIFDLLETI